MCKEEVMNREDRRHWKAMGKQSEAIHKSLEGKLSWTTEEWLRNRRKEQ